MQGRAARRQEDSNAARRASNAAASTSGASHSSRRAAPASASRQASKQAQPASMPRPGLPPGNGKTSLSGVMAPNGGSNAQPGQAAKQRQPSLHPEEEARVARALEFNAFGGTAISKTEPKSGLMKRFGQQGMLHQRVEDERRRSTGVPQHVKYAEDIMPVSPADLQKLAALATQRELGQLQTVGASQTVVSAQQMAVSSAGGHRQQVYAAYESVRSQDSFGGNGFSSRGTRPQDRSLYQAEYSSGSSSMVEPAQVTPLQPGCCLRAVCCPVGCGCTWPYSCQGLSGQRQILKIIFGCRNFYRAWTKFLRKRSRTIHICRTLPLYSAIVI